MGISWTIIGLVLCGVVMGFIWGVQLRDWQQEYIERLEKELNEPGEEQEEIKRRICGKPFLHRIDDTKHLTENINVN